MTQRIVSLFTVLVCMSLIVHTNILNMFQHISPTLVLGFLLLSTYCIGYVLEKAGLPRITGYIFGGLLFGPYFLRYFNEESIVELGFINSLALAFIAFCAGGELKASNVRKNLKNISWLITGQTLIVFLGVSFIVFALGDCIPFIAGYGTTVRIAISSIFGIISVACSPSSTIAIISETKAKGNFTDAVLSVTIAKDVVIIVLFGIVISFCEVLIRNTGIQVSFILLLFVEIIVAIGLGGDFGQGDHLPD